MQSTAAGISRVKVIPSSQQHRVNRGPYIRAHARTQQHIRPTAAAASSRKSGNGTMTPRLLVSDLRIVAQAAVRKSVIVTKLTSRKSSGIRTSASDDSEHSLT